LMATARRHHFALWPCWNWPRMKDLLLQARPFALLSMLSTASRVCVVDVLILGAILGAARVGPYVAAMGLIGRPFLIAESMGDARPRPRVPRGRAPAGGLYRAHGGGRSGARRPARSPDPPVRRLWREPGRPGASSAPAPRPPGCPLAVVPAAGSGGRRVARRG